MIDYKISFGTAGLSDIPQRYDDLPSHNIEVFQSENIQNILDAKLTKKKAVEITYRISKPNDIERKNLKKLLGDQFFEILNQSFKKSEAQDLENQVEKIKLALKNEEKWYSLTVIEKNTTGLLGDETGAQLGSNYNALMRHTNKSAKEGVSGGTFGKGSSVYTYSSGLWLWFAYSVLEIPWKNTKVRFAGRGMLAPFIDRKGNRSYDGPLWYSRPELEEEYINNYPQQGLPYTNQNAHIEAEKFGIPKRTEGDPGTTYFIPVFWPDDITPVEMSADHLQKQLKQEIIKRWFIPIYNGQLKCKISIENSTEYIIEKESLLSIPELKYKLEILDWYQNGGSPENKKFKRKSIPLTLPILTKPQQVQAEQRFGKKIGHRENKVWLDLVVRKLPDEDKGFQGFLDDDGIGTVNRIALVRNKGMIVNHYPYDVKNKEAFLKLPGDKKFEAVLFAGKMSNIELSEEEVNHLEMFISYAENPAHNEWIHSKSDLKKCNLKRFERTPFPYPENRINSIFNKIHSIIAEFFPKDDNPPTKKEICSFWRKMYKLPSAGIGKGGESTFSYRTLYEELDKSGHYTWRFIFQSQNTKKEIKLTFTPYLRSLEGPIKTIGEFENLNIPEFANLEIIEAGKTVSEVVLEFDAENEKGIPKEIEIRTCKLTAKDIFKNLDPVLEITDSINN